MAKCIFCSSNISAGTGLIYVQNDGKLLHFCSSKCRKNMIGLGRKSIKFKWARKSKE